VTYLRPALVGALVTAFAAPLAAAAQSVQSLEGPTKAVQVRVGAIIASNSGTWLDHRVAAMHPRFHTLFPYSSYRLIGEKRQWVPWGRQVRLNISNSRYVLVVPRELKNSRVSMRVQLMDDKRAIVDTILSLKDQGTFLVGGAPQPEGVLILSIGASTLP
jgi:hypothetical protein